jgi:hypothetical protein
MRHRDIRGRSTPWSRHIARYPAESTPRLSSSRFHETYRRSNPRQQKALENSMFSRAFSGCGDMQPSQIATRCLCLNRRLAGRSGMPTPTILCPAREPLLRTPPSRDSLNTFLVRAPHMLDDEPVQSGVVRHRADDPMREHLAGNRPRDGTWSLSVTTIQSLASAIAATVRPEWRRRADR